MNSWLQLALIHNEAGARLAFESACLQTLSAKFENENVHGVRLHKGDGGIDIYVGFLGVEPIDVYQCKFFINGIGDSQKNQIRNSYQTASSNERFELRNWYICLPVDLKIDEARWFDGWCSDQTAPKPQRLSPSKLMRWAEETHVADFIFQRKDSQRIEEIISLVRDFGKDNWSSIVEQAEVDSAKILSRLVERHAQSLNNAYPLLGNLAAKAAHGDRDAICEYTTSLLAYPLAQNMKIWFFNYLSDFTGEPILCRFIRRYKILIDLAKNNGQFEALSTSNFYIAYSAVISPAAKPIRGGACWPKSWLESL